MASAVISFNRVDDEAILPLLKDGVAIKPIRPFIDIQPYARAAEKRTDSRINIAARFRIDASVPWLICVAMMRPGDKLRSYELLGSALSRLRDTPWQLIVIGDGEAREQTTAALGEVIDRVHWLGLQDAEALPGILAASDLYVWPAVGEAFGIALLEAQAAGVAVVAGNFGGVSNVVNAPDCGVLVESVSPETFAQAVAGLLDEPGYRRKMAARAQQHTWKYHGLDEGASALNRVIDEVTSCRS
jgi:glycosyltransferase involved in cell wall biosynthesis